jgi:predicted transcriptional regulator|tara:strand:- start:5201 stop:5674 length:474 start_codon:yes stop_codon:yes gene_type:complete
MKSLATIFFAFFITTLSAQEAAFKKFYKVNKDKSTFSINLSASLAGSFLDDEDDGDLMNIIKKSSDFKLMIFDNEDEAVSNDFNKFKRRNKLKTLVRVKDSGSKAELFFIEKNNYIREIIIRANSDVENLVLFGLKTKITKDELAAMISSSDLKISE